MESNGERGARVDGKGKPDRDGPAVACTASASFSSAIYASISPVRRVNLMYAPRPGGLNYL